MNYAGENQVPCLQHYGLHYSNEGPAAHRFSNLSAVSNHLESLFKRNLQDLLLSLGSGGGAGPHVTWFLAWSVFNMIPRDPRDGGHCSPLWRMQSIRQALLYFSRKYTTACMCPHYVQSKKYHLNSLLFWNLISFWIDEKQDRVYVDPCPPSSVHALLKNGVGALVSQDGFLLIVCCDYCGCVNFHWRFFLVKLVFQSFTSLGLH